MMKIMETTFYPCPCCGYLVFDQPPGSNLVCPICYWEDDVTQLMYPEIRGANKVSLIEAQKNYARFAASDESLKQYVRPPLPHDIRDSSWRLIDETVDVIEHPQAGSAEPLYSADHADLYYWNK